MLPSVLFSLQLIKFNQKCTHTSTKGTKGLIDVFDVRIISVFARLSTTVHEIAHHSREST